ncbi:MarR family winged helix-turn-helix transcriptional regulator [Roseomonas elaeocarpi]|uniref:MarR family winged helix-turn-helix transcriptional regulator n=1 Tax=Roseomonas elaeocarpi TaxID=907779 RepID=A0ABV6JNE2_9PROT
MKSTNASLAAALRRVTQKWRARFDSELKGSGHTLSRARALIALSREGGSMMQRDLAAELSVEHPTLVRLLDGLEGQQLIRREPAAGQKRANRITLTPEAASVVQRVNALFEDLLDGMLATVPETDIKIAVRVMDAMVDNLELIPAPLRAAPPAEEQGR